MGYKVDNAIIMAAGLSSRFVPVCYEKPKALVSVKGDILIERQIQQLKEKGIEQIIVVVGYMKEQFLYLSEKYGVIIVENEEYATRNNHSSIYAVRQYLGNSYICSADNYFSINPFEKEEEGAYYAAVYADGPTKEWCLTMDSEDYIVDVKIGGVDQWFMLGHAFWTREFSEKFINILENTYELEETKDKLWESIYIEYIDQLKLKIKKYASECVYEFDSLDELREFDKKYLEDSGSEILKEVSRRLSCKEGDIRKCCPQKDQKGNITGFTFQMSDKCYLYYYQDKKLQEVDQDGE